MSLNHKRQEFDSGEEKGFTFRKKKKPVKPVVEVVETAASIDSNNPISDPNTNYVTHHQGGPLTTLPKISGNIRDSIVPLNSSETPVIDRNRALRDSHGNAQHSVNGSTTRRRSSISLRGKRISAANNGLCGLPHASIESADFFKHIDAEQSEPVRMRQLLVWCAQRAMRNISHLSSNNNDAQTNIVDTLLSDLQSDILQQMIAKQINLSWYHRKPSENENNNNVVKIQHPQNIENKNKIKTYKNTLEKLQFKIKDWTQTIKTINNEHAAFLDHCASREANLKALVSNAGEKQVHDMVKIHETLKDMQLIDLEFLDSDEKEDLLNWSQGRLDKENEFNLIEDKHDSYANELKSSLSQLKLEINYIQVALQKQNGLFQKKTNRFVQDLYSELLRAFKEKEAQTAEVEPQEILKMLSKASTLTTSTTTSN